MTRIPDIPELAALDSRRGLVRIPPEMDVPLTPRVRRLIDTEPFRRLSHVSQLGLVALVYPAAVHSRFEHSLGVYRLCLQFVRHLMHEPAFEQLVSVADVERLIVASLLHDLGHWPFCHVIEDLQLADIPAHESLARHYLSNGELADILRSDWALEPSTVADLLDGQATGSADRFLQSVLSGPIDCDKMDYLMRDSLHAGVPYGRNFDQARLIGSLCLSADRSSLALTEKGRTAAEMMVFARYVMFSEVYWHHAVRAATAMFQRGFYRLRERLDLATMWTLTDCRFVEVLRQAVAETGEWQLIEGLFGSRRALYKRWLEYSYFEDAQVYGQVAQQPYVWLVDCSARLAEELAGQLHCPVSADDVLIDAPPTKLEVQFQVDIADSRRGTYRSLRDVSPVVRTLAETQFDNYVKRVRVFLRPDLAKAVLHLDDPQALVRRAISRTKV